MVKQPQPLPCFVCKQSVFEQTESVVFIIWKQGSIAQPFCSQGKFLEN